MWTFSTINVELGNISFTFWIFIFLIISAFCFLLNFGTPFVCYLAERLKRKSNMKRFLVGLVVVVLGFTLVHAEDTKSKKEVESVEASAPKKSQKLNFVEVYVNDVPESIIDRLACEGAMVKEVYMAYQASGFRVYKVVIMTSDLHESVLYLMEDGSDA